ncbi:O-succinylbenzoic acid--CoA ligase [Saccharopolyspora kobensis]|uniref:O-succinylbenzoic acid--CoA ligase n=2 Tax=Saccharopolyspora kobensis TaxID=146035 RepID=A0A1H6DX37_9PSEU|nr:O-succinylbenzoic acid--CoA ligase [Saccharopolyspora kobensis]SFD87979.1 O-succinylbenzoic acid--CoA ligase [Saccharopolyspora kobensis]
MERMSSARHLQPLPVPPGSDALDVLPALERALNGEGPALLPVRGDDAAESHRLTEALSGPLTSAEDSADDPTALVIATSGSTGAPKGVLLTAAALRASAEATHRRLGGPGHWLLAMPAHHIAGIQVLVRALLAGTRPSAVDTAGGFRPDSFAAAAQHVLAAHGPHYTALVPTQLSRLLSAGGDGLASLRKFDAVLLGGAATPPALLDRALADGVRATTTYGMSETSGGCVYDGRPLDVAEVRVDGGTGPILLRGPMLARGYRHQPEAAAFAGGWFRTGDLGRWQDGRLEVLGRADDMIITGGVNVAPLPVERVLAEQPGVREVCVLGVPDPEWGQAVAAAVVPADPAGPPAEPELRAAVRARLNAAAAPKRFAFLPELPLRGPGKPDRRALAEFFQA